jgi:HD superfamily phosphohydrolase
MMESGQFKIEIEKLNRRSTVERAFDNFLIDCLVKDADFKSPHEATKELLERYMAVVRSRNNIRRNWHPQRARSCDAVTLELIKKDEFRDSVGKQLRNALTATSDGNKSIQENCIDDLANKLTDEFYNRKRKRNKPTTFQSVVREIRKLSWVKTTPDVIDEMRSNPKDYGIVKIDDTYVEIEVSLGAGKDTKISRRALDTIKNIK